MTDAADTLAGAKARSLVARQQLAATVADVRARLTPAELARDGMDDLRTAVAERGRDALDYVRARPGQAIGVVAALAIFLARNRIAGLISRAGKRAVKPLRGRRVTPKRKASPRKDTP